MREYYIRKEGDEEASGPYNLDQITSLIEAGKLDKEAYVYDIDKEEWIPIEENEELMDILYPQKPSSPCKPSPRRLKRRKLRIKSLRKIPNNLNRKIRKRAFQSKQCWPKPKVAKAMI